jgi:hypothetical protein
MQPPQIPGDTGPATADSAAAPTFARRELRIGPNPLIPLLPASVPAPVAAQPPAEGIAGETPAQITESQSSIPPPVSGAEVEQISQQIALSVARALSEGALGPATSPAVSDPLGPVLALGDLPGITARTSRQQFGEDIDVARDRTRSCLDDSYFAIDEWADARPFHAQLRDLAARTFDEDRPPAKEDVIVLARLYLHFGFADEAITLIEDDGRQSLEAHALLAVAELLLDEDISSTILADQRTCPNRAALWATLADKGAGFGDQLPSALLINEYKRLPLEVGAILGPPLIEIFLAEGDTDSAMQIMGRISEAAVEPGPAAAAASDLERALARPEDSAAILDGVIDGGRAVTAEVLSRRFELGTDEGLVVKEGLADLADAVLFERRGTEDADKLALAQFRFHLASGSFDRAAEMIGNGVISQNTLPTEALKTEFAEAAVERMQDLTFGSYAWDAALLPQDPDALDAIAGRLAALGFDARAAEIRQGNLTGSTPDKGSDLPEGTEAAVTGTGPESESRPTAAASDPVTDTQLSQLRALILASQASRARAEAALTELASPVTE